MIEYNKRDQYRQLFQTLYQYAFLSLYVNTWELREDLQSLVVYIYKLQLYLTIMYAFDLAPFYACSYHFQTCTNKF